MQLEKQTSVIRIVAFQKISYSCIYIYIYKLSISNLYICWLYIPGLCKKGCQSDGGAIGQSRNGFQHHCGKMVLVLMGAVDMYQIWKV